MWVSAETIHGALVQGDAGDMTQPHLTSDGFVCVAPLIYLMPAQLASVEYIPENVPATGAADEKAGV